MSAKQAGEVALFWTDGFGGLGRGIGGVDGFLRGTLGGGFFKLDCHKLSAWSISRCETKGDAFLVSLGDAVALSGVGGRGFLGLGFGG